MACASCPRADRQRRCRPAFPPPPSTPRMGRLLLTPSTASKEDFVFHPPRCPYRECAAHLNPAGGFYRLDGRYQPRCRAHVVQRYRCRLCRRRFSRQSFRADRGQKKPYLNAEFLRLMLACVGLRQAARVLRVSRRTVERRFVWLAQHATQTKRRSTVDRKSTRLN